MSNVKGVRLTPAKFAVDLSDGSERGFYVNQDYILQKLHRPHRGINLMYCYSLWTKHGPQEHRMLMPIKKSALHGIILTTIISPSEAD